jgi:hypothetical protein
MRRRTFAPTPPAIVSSDLSATEDDGSSPPRVHAARAPKHWEERRIERDRQTAALLNVFRQMSATMGGILALDQATAAGDVLAGVSLTFPSSGVLARSWKQAAAAVAVANHTPADVLVSVANIQGTPSAVGSGVYRVPAGTLRVLNLRSTIVTLYGLPGGLVDLVAFARPRDPVSAELNPGPLDGVLVPAGATTSLTVNLTGNLQRLVIVQSVTAVAAGSLQVTLNGVTPSGYVYPLLVGTAVTAIGVTPLRVGPGLTPSANAVANDVVPRQLQVVATAVAAVTYGIDVIAGR